MNILAALVYTFSIALPPQIRVVYPRIEPPDTVARIAPVDSNFVFGSVTPPSAELWVEGVPARPDARGAWLAFVPVNWAQLEFRVVAAAEGETTRVSVPFASPPAQPPRAAPSVPPPKRILLIGGHLRTAPQGAYYIFPDSGTVVWVDRWQDGFYRIPLAPGRFAWAPEEFCRDLSGEEPLPDLVIYTGETGIDDRWETLTIRMERRVLCRVWDEPSPPRVVCDLFGVTSHLDRIRYVPGLRQMSGVTWDQPQTGVTRLVIHLRSASWGYRLRWDEEGLKLSVKIPPEKRGDRARLRVALDPGHGGDQSGAIGPLGLPEKQVNLRVAEAAAHLLSRKGFRVFLTRDADVSLSLSDRIARADSAGADLLISIHHNALADGVNPNRGLGTSTRYYHPQSLPLAECLQRELVKSLDFPDEGVYYDNLAVVRATTMPAVLTEIAYIMLPDQEAAMDSPEYPERVAKGVLRAVKSWLDTR